VNRRQVGLTLAELLVALALVLVAASLALLSYEGARRGFREGEGAAEQQQGARSALERIRSELRLAGLNIAPDGAADSPDEAIEAAFDTAVVFRGDLDGEDPAESAEPEALLAGGARGAVAVGNDEIVAFVLAKPDGSSPDVLRFEADVKDVPRDGVIESVEIPGIALVHDDPPYTLYRITLSNDPLAWGSGRFLVRAPLLDNVRSLSFRYRGARGMLNDRFDPATPSEDIGGADTPQARRARAAIRAIEVEIEALTRDENPRAATRAYRKLRLRRWVAPRNVGVSGRPEPWLDSRSRGRRERDAENA